MTPSGVFAKKHFYQGRVIGKLFSITLGLADWLFPGLSRTLFRAQPRNYPITVAQWILSRQELHDADSLLDELMACSSARREQFGSSWGLGFPWMSKNGLYDEDMPFVTHTPYALEALIRIYRECENRDVKERALAYFSASRQFLDGLKCMYEDENAMALSYAPIDEPRIVVNANSYACFSYALHAAYSDSYKEEANLRCEKLLNWVLAQQEENGSWYYYADKEAGNFIDGFHSCFVLKNLLKTLDLRPELISRIEPAVARGMAYLRREFVDSKSGLLRRFTCRDIKDPFVWDLYDQAEYVGLLVQLGELDEAGLFLSLIQKHFYRNGHWYCRKDFFGRRWGKDFLRWGIMPLFHQQHEYAKAVQKKETR